MITMELDILQHSLTDLITNMAKTRTDSPYYDFLVWEKAVVEKKIAELEKLATEVN